MELEVRGVNGAARDRLRGRVESHRAELKRLAQEFQLAKRPKDESIEMSREDSWESNITEDQKKRLLDTSERIDRTGRTLQNGYRMVLETEEIGSHVLKELHEQRETIQKGRGRVRYRVGLFFKNQAAFLYYSKPNFIVSVTRDRCRAGARISVVIRNDFQKPSAESYFSRRSVNANNCCLLSRLLQLQVQQLKKQATRNTARKTYLLSVSFKRYHYLMHCLSGDY